MAGGNVVLTGEARRSGWCRQRRVGLAGGALLVAGLAAVSVGLVRSPAGAEDATPVAARPALEIADATVRHLEELDLLAFELEVAGEAVADPPPPRGAIDGAPILAYVIPTSLPPTAVGFEAGEGIVVLAITAHPDFDDTPLWDENLDRVYDNDGETWQSHWDLVVPDERVPGGLAVLEADAEGQGLPPTSPGLPVLLDSPGFPVYRDGSTLLTTVPVPRVYGETGFMFDAATALREVNTADEARPFLGVYAVYDVLSGDLSLPYEVESE